MKRLAIISGKGGTGKTMVAGAMASLIPYNLILADCDVDAANLELLFSPQILSVEPYWGLKVAEIDDTLCVQCGSCQENCRFDAIEVKEGNYVVNPVKCEGCAVCTLVCPVEAVLLRKRENGKIFFSKTRNGPLSHARLEPGSGTSGLLVTEVKKQANKHEANHEFLLIDGPPGIGCPLIATVSGVDAVLVVTEPSTSGLHDLRRVVRVASGFGIDIYVVINKYTLEESITRQIEDYCREQKIPVVGKIPFDPMVIEAIRKRKPVTDYDTPAAKAIRMMWNSLEKYLSGHE
jgi:MinD superfamily P-loop ATPase